MGGPVVEPNDPGPVLAWAGRNTADHVRGAMGRAILDGRGGNDTLGGGDGADTIIGGAGDDRLFGGAGEDWLQIGAGDRARGGTGADVFVIDHGAGRIAIRDFEPGDRIDLSAFGVTFSDADRGLEDGFSMAQHGADLRLRLRDAEGQLLTILLQNTDASTLFENDFLF